MKTNNNNSTIGFWIFASLAAILLIVSFILPPMGVISPSALQGAAILLGFAALHCVIDAIHRGIDAKFRKGDIEVVIDGHPGQGKVEVEESPGICEE